MKSKRSSQFACIISVIWITIHLHAGQTKDNKATERAWQTSTQVNTPEKYFGFLEKFPQSKHAEEARKALASKDGVLALAKNADTKWIGAVLDINPALVNVTDKEGFTPLHICADPGHGDRVILLGGAYSACVEVLLTKGADVNAATSSSAFGTVNLITPLHLAACYYFPTLKNSTVNINGKPLADVLMETQLKSLRSILSRRPNVNAADSDGNTPLHCAVAAGRSDMVKLLLASGADASIKNLAGDTPYARPASNKSIESAGQGSASSAFPAYPEVPTE